MATKYAWDTSDDESPGSDVLPITPHDTNAVTTTRASGEVITGVRALRANGAGVITVITEAGNTRAMNFLAGETRPVFATHVKSTATTATGIEGHV